MAAKTMGRRQKAARMVVMTTKKGTMKEMMLMIMQYGLIAGKRAG